jgi:hypothetical protein
MPHPTVQLPRWLLWAALALMAALVVCDVYLLFELRRLSAEVTRTDDGARARDAEVQRAVKRAESHILNLYKASDPPAADSSTESPQRWYHAVVTDASKEFTITTDSPTGGVVTFRNTGAVRVQDVFMVINDRRWFRSLDNAKWVTAGASGDREKAFLLWQYVCSNTYAWLPPDLNGPESRNAAKCLTVYGYGWCGELSNTLLQLARVAGLEGRMRTLQGHVVPELFYDGAWHVLDPMLEVFYPDPENGGEAAGVDDLARNASLVERVPHPNGQDPALLADYYRTEPNPEDRAPAFTTSPVGFRMAPGDEISFHWVPIHALRVQREQRGMDTSLRPWEDVPGVIPWHSAVYAARPPYINRAVFRTEPLLSRAAAKTLALDGAVLGDLTPPPSREKQGPRLGITSEAANAPARTALFVNVPLVITDARLSGYFLPSQAGDKCAVSIWADDQALQSAQLTAAEAGRAQPFSLSIGATLSGPKRPARYSYVARIEMSLKDPGRGGVYGLRAETQCQMTPFTPWRLNHGENKIQVRTVGENTQCDLFFSWHEAHSAQHFKDGPENVRAEPTVGGRLSFHWDLPATSDGRAPDFYEVNLSEREDFAWPATPGCFIELPADAPTWIAPAPFPAKPGPHYFRVRGKNAFGHPSPWSAPLTFRAPQ